MVSTNCLKILASLPPHTFLSQCFSASREIFIAYKLNVIVAYTGTHYMVFIRVRPSGCKDRVWTMFNDTETKQFDKYSELVHYLVTSNAVPTMVIYEF